MKKVLIVDDEFIMWCNFVKILWLESYEVFEVGDGKVVVVLVWM